MTHLYMLFDQSSVTKQEKLWDNSMISEGSALRYAIIMLRLFRERIDHENEEGVIVDMLIFTYNVWLLCL